MLDDGHRFLYGSLVACTLGQKLKDLETIRALAASSLSHPSPATPREESRRAASEVFDQDSEEDLMGMDLISQETPQL